MLGTADSVASKEIAGVRLPGRGGCFTRNLHHSIGRYPKLWVRFEAPRKSSARPLGCSRKQMAVKGNKQFLAL